MAHILASAVALLQVILRPSNIALFAALYIVCQLVFNLFIWRKFLSPLRHLPTPPGSGLLFGHAPTVLNDTTGATLREWRKKYGPYLRLFGTASSHNIFIVEPEHLDKVLGKDAHNYPKPSHLLGAMEVMFGHGLLATTGDEHRLMRKAMSGAFSLSNIMAQVHIYHEVTDRLVKIWKDQISSVADPSKGKVMSIFDFMNKTTLDILSLSQCGYDANTLHNPEDRLAVASKARISVQSGSNAFGLFALMTIPGLLKVVRSRWLYRHRHWLRFTKPTADLGIMIEAMHAFTQLARELFDEKTREYASHSAVETKRDIVSIVVRMRKEEQEKGPTVYAMSDEILTDQVVSILVAGHSTTGIILTYALWALANDQQSQTKLREEVTPVLDANTNPDYRTLKVLPWLDSVIMETLRIFPPVQLEERIATKTDYIGDVLVPKGSRILMPVCVINTDKAVWGEDAEEFNPSRWLNLPDKYHPHYSFLSFFAGPHHCLGRTMALMLMKVVLATVIYNFKIEPAYEGQTENLSRGVLMNFTDDMPLLVKPVRD